jgi:transcriptional regulator of acetoin/glycerol metabolism
VTFQEATRQFQARLLRDALEQTEWNVVEVARQLDLARSHVYNLIRAFGLERSGTRR